MQKYQHLAFNTNSFTHQLEYTKWKQLNNWMALNSRFFTEYELHELMNCVTRYFTSMMVKNEVDADLHKTRIYNKFLQELSDKKLKIKTPLHIENLSVPISDVPEQYSVVEVDGGAFVLFSCGYFAEKISKSRYNILREKAETSDILLALLNYQMFPSASLSWHVPTAVYNHLFEKYNLTLEGCASPMNSQMLPLGGKWCSPFVFDKVFGSMGDVFSVDLSGEVSLLNPPFVEDFMVKLAKKVIDTMDTALEPTTVIFIAPAWTDAESHILLSKTKYLSQVLHLLKGTYSYESLGVKIPAKFNSTIFVLSNVHKDYQTNYSSMLPFFE